MNHLVKKIFTGSLKLSGWLHDASVIEARSFSQKAARYRSAMTAYQSEMPPLLMINRRHPLLSLTGRQISGCLTLFLLIYAFISAPESATYSI
jgi:hypothetical protein